MTTTRQPNLLFLFPDQWRWDWLGCAGNTLVRTPHIDALAARGVRFDRCRVNSPLCSPSRACLATLSRYDRCGVPGNHTNTDPGRAVLFRSLRDAGYRVGTCGKDDLHKADASWSRDGWMPILGRYGFTEALAHAGKWDSVGKGKNGHAELLTARYAQQGILQPYLDHMARLRNTPDDGWPGALPWSLPEHLHTDAVCGANALALIDGFPPGHPWCLWVNFPGPHDPHDPPVRHARHYDNTSFPDPVGMQGEAASHQLRRRLYSASCEHIDDWVGRLVDAVERRGELEDTLVVLASDHGEMLGDHGRYHKHVPQEGSVRVPCILAGSGIDRRGTSQALVELIDVGASLLDAAGIGSDRHGEGRSLLPLCRNERPDSQHRPFTLSGLDDRGTTGWRSITTADHKLVRQNDGTVSLFDLNQDPGELTDLAPSDPATVKTLAALLAAG